MLTLLLNALNWSGRYSIELRGVLDAQRGQAHIVLGWLNTLPDELVRARLMLCIILRAGAMVGAARAFLVT